MPLARAYRNYAINAVFVIAAADLIFGNLFGSNLFNLAILAVNDILYLEGPLLSYTSSTHGITANAAMAMTAAAVIGLTYRASRKRFLFAWDSLAIVAIYTVAVGAMFSLR